MNVPPLPALHSVYQRNLRFDMEGETGAGGSKRPDRFGVSRSHRPLATGHQTWRCGDLRSRGNLTGLGVVSYTGPTGGDMRRAGCW